MPAEVTDAPAGHHRGRHRLGSLARNAIGGGPTRRGVLQSLELLRARASPSPPAARAARRRPAGDRRGRGQRTPPPAAPPCAGATQVRSRRSAAGGPPTSPSATRCGDRRPARPGSRGRRRHRRRRRGLSRSAISAAATPSVLHHHVGIDPAGQARRARPRRISTSRSSPSGRSSSATDQASKRVPVGVASGRVVRHDQRGGTPRSAPGIAALCDQWRARTAAISGDGDRRRASRAPRRWPGGCGPAGWG